MSKKQPASASISDLRFPIVTDMVECYPELTEWPLHDSDIHYMMFRYDPGSEVQKRPNGKNEYAAKLAGIDEKRAELLSAGENPEFNKCLTLFFRALNHRAWEVYVSGEIMLNDLLERVRKPISNGSMDEDKEIKAYQLRTDCYTKATQIKAEQEKVLKEIAGEGVDIVKKTDVVRLTPEAMAGKK